MFLWTQKIKFDETFKNCHWGSRMIYPKVRKLSKVYAFFQNNFSLILFRWRENALLTILPHSFRHKTEKFSLKAGNGWRIEKRNLTPKVLPRKDPLTRRVQFCKPCLRKFSQKWSWINQDTKRTKKICTIFRTENFTGIRSLDTQEEFRQMWRSFPARIQDNFQSKSGNCRTILIFCRKKNFIQSFLWIRWTRYWQNW